MKFILTPLLVASLLLASQLGLFAGPVATTKFVRGDVNTDGQINIADAIALLSSVFPVGPPSVLSCEDAADTNDDGTINIADAVNLLGSLFGSSLIVLPPPDVCGMDPTPDVLSCLDFPPCFLPNDCNQNGIDDLEDILGGGVLNALSSPGILLPPLPGSATDTISMPFGQTVFDLDVRLALEHPQIGQLQILLEHNGFVASLVTYLGSPDCTPVGGYLDIGMNMILDEQAQPGLHFYQDILGGPPMILEGAWQPDMTCGETSLSVFNGGEVGGDWTIHVINDSLTGVGQLMEWELVFRTSPASSTDVNKNLVPDECEGDCNNNGIADPLDVDCDQNGTPDECDIANNPNLDLDNDGVLDSCQGDCNGNSVLDSIDIQMGTSTDFNNNASPDECDIASGISLDLNFDGIPDEAQLAGQDCNNNELLDEYEIAEDLAQDCNLNGVPDSCDILSGFSLDLNFDGIPDECGPPLVGPFQIVGHSANEGTDGDLIQIDLFPGPPSPNPLDYCIAMGGPLSAGEVLEVNPNGILIELNGIRELGTGPIVVVPGIGIPAPPDFDPNFLFEDGRGFTGFPQIVTGSLFSTRAVSVQGNTRDFFRLSSSFDAATQTLNLPVAGNWQEDDKVYFHMHMLLPNGSFWDWSETITFPNGTARDCALKVAQRYNAAATAAGCDCQATVPGVGSDIAVNCAGGASAGFGGASLKEWSEKNRGTRHNNTFDIKRTRTGFEITNTKGTNSETVTLPITAIKIGEKRVEFGCKYYTDLNGRAGLLKTVAASGGNNLRIIQTVKGSRTLKRAGSAPRNLLPVLANYALDGGTAANPDYGFNWPLTQGTAILDAVPGPAVAGQGGLLAGDKICFACEFQTFVVCDNRVIGFVSWDANASLCIGATPAANAWANPQPNPSANWVPRNMTNGNAFKTALDHLNTLVDNNFD